MQLKVCELRKQKVQSQTGQNVAPGNNREDNNGEERSLKEKKFKAAYKPTSHERPWAHRAGVI